MNNKSTPDKKWDQEMKTAAQSGDMNAVMSKLSPAQAEQLKKILSNEAETKKLLSTPQAQALLKRLSKHE